MPADSKRVETIFHAACALPAADRGAFLAAECGADADLRARVERLLAAHAELEAPPGTASFAPGAGTATFDGPASAPTGVHTPQPDAGTLLAGKYKLIEEIGEGGMGTVWMAEQTEPVRRRVAVKLIKAGMDSRAVLARFEAERQALALMDHPNIAKVLDAGATDDGRPFFVMELVKGVPITEFCDARRLTPRERLELFVPVCQAIQHAHQKGVIHRDIKPSNVLVALYDDRPVPKVIDFGVSKATGQPLTEKTLATGFGAVVGTPEYMSPEQASFNNLDIDTRSDVYALGVLLYELLAGSPPFSRTELEKKGLVEILRVVREVEPPRPSTKLSTADALPTLSANRGTEPAKLTRLLRGELDWIVMKALEKDRNRRYESANGFAADVQRYLAGEPVQAVPPSAGYRLRKFLRKNRATVVAASTVALALLAGTVVSAAFAVRAERNAERAEKNEQAATEAKIDSDRNAALATNSASLANAETARVRWLLYAANFGRIQDALRERRLGRVRQLLEETKPGPGEPDLRGVEWFYVDHLINNHKDVVSVHDSWAPGAFEWIPSALSRDGRWLAMVSHVGELSAPGSGPQNGPFGTQIADVEFKLWDLTTKKAVITPRRNSSIHYACLQPIGSAGLVAWNDRQTVTIYDPASKTEKSTLTLAGMVKQIRFDADGKRMAALVLIPNPKGAPKGVPQPAKVLQQVEVWDVERKERLHLIECGEVGGGSIGTGLEYGANISLAPDGRRIAVAVMPLVKAPDQLNSDDEGAPPPHRIAVWEVGNQKPLFELLPGNWILLADPFSADSRTLAVARGRSVVLLDAQTGKPRRTYGLAGGTRVSAVAFSPDGRWLAVGDASAAITVFAIDSDWASEQLVGHEQAIRKVAFRGNDTLVSLCEEGKVKEWSLAHLPSVVTPKQELEGLRVADPTGRYLLTAARDQSYSSREAILWDTASGSSRELFRKSLTSPGTSLPANMVTVRFSPDGRRVSVAYRGAAPQRRPRDGVRSVGLLLPTPPDWLGGFARMSLGLGQHLPPPSRSVVWDVPSGELVLDLPEFAPARCFSPDGRFVVLEVLQADRTQGREPHVSVWDLAARPARRIPLEETKVMSAGPNEHVYWHGVFGPGSRYLTVTTNTVHYKIGELQKVTATFLLRWNLETGRLVFARRTPDLPPEQGGPYIIFSPDVTLALYAPNDREDGGIDSPQLRLWDIRPDGEMVPRLTITEGWIAGKDEGVSRAMPQLRAGFTPDGKHLLAVGERQARLWNLDALDKPIILRGIRGYPMRMMMSADGRRLVLVSHLEPDRFPPQMELKVWDLASGQELFSMPVTVPPESGPRGLVEIFDGKQRLLPPRPGRN